MKRLRNLLIASATAALALSAMGAPAAAATGATLAIVHGIPGAVVDVCVNGGVLKTDFSYGQKIVLDNALPAGSYKVVVKAAANAQPCKGDTILKVKTELDGTENLTAVAGFVKGAPGLRIFDHDAALGVASASVSAPGSGIIVTHAAKAGKVDVFAAPVVVPSAPKPTIKGLKRGESVGLSVPPLQWVAWVAAPGTIKPIMGPKISATLAGKINHYVAVGDAPGNFRIVSFRTTLDV